MVLPTRGRGDATMVTEELNDIASPDAPAIPAQANNHPAAWRTGLSIFGDTMSISFTRSYSLHTWLSQWRT